MTTIGRDLLEPKLAAIAAMPDFLARACRTVRPERLTSPPRSGAFSLVEQIWHLSDLEREGYAVRIERILAEEHPSLADFDGDRIARERRYVELDPERGLASFDAARARNVARLRAATSADLARSARQDGVGVLTLADVVGMIARHDEGHRVEIEALLGELDRDEPSR